jgi:hypothetical protein
MEEIRRVMPQDASMAQFALRWILMFDAGDMRHSRRENTWAGGGQFESFRLAGAIARNYGGGGVDLFEEDRAAGRPALVATSTANA